jgi:flagellin
MAYESMSFAVGYTAEYGGIQNTLFQVQKKLDKTMEKLSTGKRINDMKDDEGGKALADVLSSWKTGTDESIYNLKEFITMTKIAEKALNDIQDILFQMKQAVDRLNGLEDATDRSSTQSQLTILAAAINKIVTHTEYRGFKLFNMDEGNNATYLEHTVNGGVIANMTHHADRYIRYGAGAEDFLSWDLGMDPEAQHLGKVTGIVISTGQVSNYFFNGKNVKEIATELGLDLTTREGKIQAIKAALGENVKVDVLTASGKVVIQTPGDFVYATAPSQAAHWVRTVLFGTYEREFTNAGQSARINDGTALDTVGANPDDQTGMGGVSGGSHATGVLGNRGDAVYYMAGDVGTDHSSTGRMVANEGLFDVNVMSNENAALARVQIEAAISQIEELRGVLAAMQHQAEALINQRMEESVAVEAQISHIMDTDYAKELAEFTRQQIAQQAGVSMLAQKRQMAQLITQLLR